MEKTWRNMKEYEENMKKYVDNKKEYPLFIDCGAGSLHPQIQPVGSLWNLELFRALLYIGSGTWENSEISLGRRCELIRCKDWGTGFVEDGGEV